MPAAKPPTEYGINAKGKPTLIPRTGHAKSSPLKGYDFTRGHILDATVLP
jgi:hypothetical protein